VVDELVRSGLLSALANLADLDMGEVSNKLMPLKDEVVMVLVREEEIGEHQLKYKLHQLSGGSFLEVLQGVLCRVLLCQALGNLADLDMGQFCNKLMPLKDEVVMVLVRKEEIGELLLVSLLHPCWLFL
jgi:hypothetical protein